MKKITIIAIILVIILILDSLYLLPLYVPLDTKPDNIRSATYLAKTIAKKARCVINLLDVEYHTGDTVVDFDCNFGSSDKNTYTPFYIHIFLNDKVKNEWLNQQKKHTYNNKCFKKGLSYIICDGSWYPNIILPKTGGKPISDGQKYYNQFPGENINYKDN